MEVKRPQNMLFCPVCEGLGANKGRGPTGTTTDTSASRPVYIGHAAHVQTRAEVAGRGEASAYKDRRSIAAQLRGRGRRAAESIGHAAHVQTRAEVAGRGRASAYADRRSIAAQLRGRGRRAAVSIGRAAHVQTRRGRGKR